MNGLDAQTGPQLRVFTREGAAQLLLVSVAQIDAAIKRGELADFRVGKHSRITEDALRKFAGLDSVVTAA